MEQYYLVRISKALLLGKSFDWKTKQKIFALLAQKSRLTIKKQDTLLSSTCRQTVTITIKQRWLKQDQRKRLPWHVEGRSHKHAANTAESVQHRHMGHEAQHIYQIDRTLHWFSTHESHGVMPRAGLLLLNLVKFCFMGRNVIHIAVNYSGLQLLWEVISKGRLFCSWDVLSLTFMLVFLLLAGPHRTILAQDTWIRHCQCLWWMENL